MRARESPLRGFLSVIAGFLVLAAIVTLIEPVVGRALGRSWGQPSLRYFLAVFTLGALSGIAGGYTAARLARIAPVWHAAALALLVLFAGTAIAAREPVVGEPEWYHSVATGSAMLGAIAGGWIARVRAASG